MSLDSECTMEKSGLVELKSKAAVEIVLATPPDSNSGAYGKGWTGMMGTEK